MFEFFTEAARRVIFFARYEASQFGSSSIETEHFLLALLREHGRTSRCLAPLLEYEIREEVETQVPRLPRTSTSIDLPLSAECKRILSYANEEGNPTITPDHLLIGILREESCLAAKLLQKHGIGLESARADAASRPAAPQPGFPHFVMPFGSPSPELSRLLTDAVRTAADVGATVAPEHVLLSFAASESSRVAQFLAQHGITADEVRREFRLGQ